MQPRNFFQRVAAGGLLLGSQSGRLPSITVMKKGIGQVVNVWTCFIVMIILLISSLSPRSARAIPAEIAFEAPPGLANPLALPASIQEAELLDGWIYLYNQLDPVQLWDGSLLTGRDLAQFVLDRSIPIVWDTENQCGGASCSAHYCHEDTCVYRDEIAGPAPIYISLWNRNHFQNLVWTLSHEIFHRREPFGPVWDTCFEEYWAYKVGGSISGHAWPVFEGYDPLVPAQLIQWLKDNQIVDYIGLPYYPARLAGYGKHNSQGVNRTAPLPWIIDLDKLSLASEPQPR